MLPLIHYLFISGRTKQFTTKVAYKEDRELIKRWFHTVLLKRIFGGQADTVLKIIRDVVKDEIKKDYPRPLPRTEASYDSVYLKRLRDRLIKEGMTAEYVEEIISKAEKHLSYIDRAKSSMVYDKVGEILEERISVDSDLFSGTGRGKRKVIFLIGPTGSGKTTTIAKLAAKYFLHMGRIVSLYTTDNYRIAAIEQLKRYADTMDIPFYPVKEEKKFREALQRDGSELILIDTAGYNHKNPDFLEKMQSYHEVFTEKEQVENILVLPSTFSYNNMKTVMETYEPLGYKRVILSKIDETDYLSTPLELIDTHNKTLAYISIGQEVPFDIIPGSKKIFADLILHPEKLKEIKGETFSVLQS